MSRHSELFDRLARENGFLGEPISATMHSMRRGPMLPIPDRSRTEIEKVVNRLYSGTGAATHRVVVFTSFEPASGSSWVCAHSADLLAASTDASVCMVDANLRAPSLHKHLDVMNHNGLTDLLSDSTTNIKAVATKLFGRDLWLLSSGSGEDGECFVQSDRMRDRIAELRSSFDCVMIDAPPVTACNDALTLGQLADGVVLVLRAGATRRESARRLKGELAAFGVTLLGAILNDYSSPIPEVVENWI